MTSKTDGSSKVAGGMWTWTTTQQTCYPKAGRSMDVRPQPGRHAQVSFLEFFNKQCSLQAKCLSYRQINNTEVLKGRVH